MPDDLHAQVVKRGETCVTIGFHRYPQGSPSNREGIQNSVGLTVTVKVLPLIEAYFKDLAQEESATVGSLGRHWIQKEGQTLRVWMPRVNFEPEGGSVNKVYALDGVGHPLLGPIERDEPIVNLSFLRLEGASEGSGVSFGLKGVYTVDAIRKMRDLVSTATRRFYIDYIRPVDVSVAIVTQELQG